MFVPSDDDVTYSSAYGNFCCVEPMLFNGSAFPTDIATTYRDYSSRLPDVKATSAAHWPTNSSLYDYVTFPTQQTVESMINLMMFGQWYQGVHGYLSIVVCSFGIVANLMNVIVLTRRAMISPTNYILTALAITDLLTMASYLPYAVYFYCIAAPDPAYKHRLAWIVFLLFHNNFIITMHTAAMWLTVLLAMFRYIVVCHHTHGPRLCSLRRTKLAIAAVLCTTTVCCSMHYVIYKPIPYDGATIDDDDVTSSRDTHDQASESSTAKRAASGAYWIEDNQFVPVYYKMFTFWLYGVVLKVAPCALLTLLSSLLVRAMRRRAFRRRSSLGLNARRRSSSMATGGDKSAAESDRTTTMLVLVVLLFVATELPQGVLAMLSGFNSWIFDSIYVPLGDVLDFLVLINSSANFILYCAMSTQFRTTFRTVFVDGCCASKSGIRDSATSRFESRKTQFTAVRS